MGRDGRFPQIAAPVGRSVVGVLTKDGRKVALADLWTRRETVDEPHLAGQWFVEFRSNELDTVTLGAGGWAQLLSRVGVHPLGLRRRFAAALLRPEPLAVVVDTSALYQGALNQIAWMRGDRPVYLALPDQTFMEVQSHRERKSGKDDATQRIFRCAPHRLLGRVRSSGHIVHFVRPPEAMVRYFGIERGSAGHDGTTLTESDDIGPSYHRDRLVLEAARDLRRTVPELPLWILTGDQNLAIQADMEQFQSALTWVPRLPASVRYTSPWILPHTLELKHVPVEDLLNELLWTFGRVWVQPAGTAKGTLWSLPAENKVALTLLRAGPIVSQRELDLPRQLTATLEKKYLFEKIPTAEETVSALLELGAGGAPPDHVAAYLLALGWASSDGGAGLVASDDGCALADTWRDAGRDNDPHLWCDFMDRAADAIQRLPLVVLVLAAMSEAKGHPVSGDQLKATLELPRRVIDDQLAFASTLGVTIRLSGKNWAAAQPGDDKGRVLKTVKDLQMAASAGSRGVRTDQVFTALLKESPLPLPRFRRALLQLAADRKLEFGAAGAPSPAVLHTRDPVRVKTIVPDGSNVKALDVELGKGDFLSPLESTQVLVLGVET